MTYQEHLNNWIAWHQTMRDLRTGLEHVPHCQSIEHQMLSPRNAGFGNADVGETPYDLQRVQRRPPIVQNERYAQEFDRLFLRLSWEQKMAMKLRYLPWSARCLDVARAVGPWSKWKQKRLRDEAAARMTQYLTYYKLL